MDFDLNTALPLLERTPVILDAWLRDLPDAWTRQNEGGETWSPFAIVGHLLHGERTDWVARMQIILGGGPDKSFAPFDRFAQLHDNQQKSLAQLLSEFTTARSANLAWLRGQTLGDEQLELTGVHPVFGSVTLRNLISTWVVHDLDHLAQVARVLAFQYRDAVGPWKTYLRILPKDEAAATS